MVVHNPSIVKVFILEGALPRSILLMEADGNAINKIIFGIRMMQTKSLVPPPTIGDYLFV
jgi:hypothetical protein